MAALKKIFSSDTLTKTARNIIKVSFGDVTSKIFNVGSVLILIRGLSIEDYTTYIFISSVGVYLSGLIGSGINVALVRYSLDYVSRFGSKPKALYQLAFLVELLVFLVLSTISFFFIDKISVFLFGCLAYAQNLALGLIFGLGLLILNFCRTIYQAEEEFNGLVLTSWISQISIFLLLLTSYILKKLNVNNVIVIYTVIYFMVSGAIFVLRRDLFNIKRIFTELQTNKELVINFLKGLGWLVGYFFVLSIMSRLDIYFLSKYANAKEIATYGVAFQYYGMGILLLASIHSVLLPRFAHVEMQAREAQVSFLSKWLKVSVWLLLPILAFDLFGKEIFLFINGSRYENAFPILVVFSLGIWLSMMLSPLVNIIISKGEFKFLFVLSVFGLAFNLLGNFFFVPLWGGIGAAAVIILTQNIVIQTPILLKGLKQ